MTTVKDDGVTSILPGRWASVDWRGKTRRIRLVVVDQQGHELEAAVADDWCRMRDHARRDGIELRINTAFRERAHQQRLYGNWLRYSAYVQALDAWREAGKHGEPPKKVDWAPKAAAPGRSTHEIGCAPDIQRADGDDPSTPAADSPVDKWLNLHAHTYGFFRDVPKEDWHYTNVGAVARIAGK
jgi:LAS superfamily LD-carboxypeptidase LdcB